MDINFSRMNDKGVLYIEAAGLSTEAKPGNVSAGSWFHEVDTKKVYAFDGSDWVEQAELSA